MEFDIIERFFSPLSLRTRPGALTMADLAIGDDGALITPPPNSQLVVVTDTLVKGVHFPEDTAAYDIGWKALAVNLSDLAAMGATPAFYSLALTLPEQDADWLTDFSQGLADCAQPYQMPLIGGDTTRGPLTISITAQGWVPQGRALMRNGAQLGDDVYVSGLIGEAGLGLELALNRQAKLNGLQQAALDRLNRPVARVGLGVGLRDLANSAIDVSDGLLADLAHILNASKLGAQIETSQLAMSEAVKQWVGANRLKALSAGDDYELCFTASPSKRPLIQALAKEQGVVIHRIGCLVQPPGLVVDGVLLEDALGYQHF